MLDWWQGLLLFIGGLLVGAVAAFFITRYIFQKHLRLKKDVLCSKSKALMKVKSSFMLLIL